MFKSLRNSYLMNDIVGAIIRTATLSSATFLGAISTALADRIPHTAFSGPYVYTSQDMDPITINFVYGGDFEKPNPPIAEIVSLPRAFVNIADGYSTRPTQTEAKNNAESQKYGFDELPDVVQTFSIKVSISDPEGLPYTVAVHKWGSKGQTKVGNNLSYAAAHSTLADITYIKDVRRNPPSHFRKGLKFDDKRRSKFADLVTSSSSSEDDSSIYYSDGRDGIWRIKCASDLKRARAWHNCTYTIDLADNFYASLQFLDFRVHGGMPFARKRIKTFRKSMCQYFDCN